MGKYLENAYRLWYTVPIAKTLYACAAAQVQKSDTEEKQMEKYSAPKLETVDLETIDVLLASTPVVVDPCPYDGWTPPVL